jgi:hypothetical protein
MLYFILTMEEAVYKVVLWQATLLEDLLGTT